MAREEEMAKSPSERDELGRRCSALEPIIRPAAAYRQFVGAALASVYVACRYRRLAVSVHTSEKLLLNSLARLIVQNKTVYNTVTVTVVTTIVPSVSYRLTNGQRPTYQLTSQFTTSIYGRVGKD